MGPRRPKRGDDVPPPATHDEYTLKYATKESLSLPELEKRFAGACATMKAALKRTPGARTELNKPLKGRLAWRNIAGTSLPQWQYDLSAAARVWYCVDREARVVWITLASAGHPKSTETSAKGASTRR